MNMFYLLPLIFAAPYKSPSKKTKEQQLEEQKELKEAFVVFKEVAKQEEELDHA